MKSLSGILAPVVTTFDVSGELALDAFAADVAAHLADGVLVVAPHYYGAAAMSAAALRDHYTQVADESPVPVVLYSIPKYMHFAIPPEVVSDLARHENIVGLKDSSGDLALLERYLE